MVAPSPRHPSLPGLTIPGNRSILFRSAREPMNLGSINFLVLDVDGVLTAGDVTFDDKNGRLMSFDIHDGMAIKLWRRAGYAAAILSGRVSAIVDRRAGELGIEMVRQGIVEKGAELTQMLESMDAAPESTCYVGDDLPDVAAMCACGFRVAVANAVHGLKRHADYVTRRRGGCGAVAEVVELILRKQRRWAELTAQG